MEDQEKFNAEEATLLGFLKVWVNKEDEDDCGFRAVCYTTSRWVHGFKEWKNRLFEEGKSSDHKYLDNTYLDEELPTIFGNLFRDDEKPVSEFTSTCSMGFVLAEAMVCSSLREILYGSGALALLMPLLPYDRTKDGIRQPKSFISKSFSSMFHAWVILNMFAFYGSLIGLKLKRKRRKVAMFSGYVAVVAMFSAICLLCLFGVMWALGQM